MTFSFSPLENALKQLNLALAAPPRNDLERDGTIQRFEYCFEMCWKTLRSLLLKAGRTEVSGSPRPLFREAMQEQLITDFTAWNRFLEARNESSHTDHLRTAEEVYAAAKDFAPVAADLLRRMQDFHQRLGPT